MMRSLKKFPFAVPAGTAKGKKNNKNEYEMCNYK
jgi:hypothetical protein